MLVANNPSMIRAKIILIVFIYIATEVKMYSSTFAVNSEPICSGMKGEKSCIVILNGIFFHYSILLYQIN